MMEPRPVSYTHLTILWLAEKLFNIGLVALVVIFQPELRNALENIGGKTFLRCV